MKKSPKKIIKNTAKIAAIVGGLVLGGYHFSEKIGFIQHDVQKELKDNLGKKEILKDQETNDIIELMSGKVSQKKFDALLARHGYANDTLKIDTLIQPNEALYKTILEMQTKYGNPKISFSGDFKNFETGKNEPDRARFNPVTNAIGVHQLDNVLIRFHNIKKIERLTLDHITGAGGLNPDTRQKYLLNNRIAELAHAKQLKERGLIKMGIDAGIDYTSSGFNYDKTYDIKGTEEYQAHTEYEPLLVQEFIETYKKYCDSNSNEGLRKLAKFNAGFFEAFRDDQQAYEYLQILEKKGDAEADLVLGKLFLDEYEEYFGSKAGFAVVTESDSSMTEMVLGKKYSAIALFGECLGYFAKSYRLGNLDAGLALVDIAYNFRWGENMDLVIEIGEDLIKNHIKELQPGEIKSIYRKLGSAYYQKDNNEKGAKYFALSDKYSSGEDPGRY